MGLMVVGKSGETFYANLWLPGRYSIDHFSRYDKVFPRYVDSTKNMLCNLHTIQV